MMGTESEILYQFRMLFPARVANIPPSLSSTVLTKEARVFYYYYFLLFSSPREPH